MKIFRKCVLEHSGIISDEGARGRRYARRNVFDIAAVERNAKLVEQVADTGVVFSCLTSGEDCYVLEQECFATVELFVTDDCRYRTDETW